MSYRAFFIILGTLVFLAGCSVVSKRLFQDKVPAPIQKSSAQIETERRAAELIARFLQEPKQLKPVALGLSNSLGAPAAPIPAATVEELPKAADTSTKELQASIVAMQKKLDDLMQELKQNQGKKIEGTGFAIAGPSAIALVVGVIVLCVIFPPAFAVLAFAYRRVKATAAIVVNKVEEASQEAIKNADSDEKKKEVKEAFVKLKDNLGRKMDRKQKNTVLDLKKVVV